MNWVGDLIQDNIEETDTVLDLGCGIMQPLLDVVPNYPETRLKCKRLFGVDIYQPYLDFLNTLGIETLRWDLRDIPLPFKDKSYDVILLTDVLEHLNHIEDVNKLLVESNRIAKKKIIVLTPNVFVKNLDSIQHPYPYEVFTKENKYQEHHLLIEKEYLKRSGFKVSKAKSKYWFAIKNNIYKILHVWDCAGVAGCLSKYQNKLGYESKVFIGNKIDAYGFDDFYDEITLKIKPSKIPKVLKPKTDSLISKIYRHLRYYKDVKNYIYSYDPDILHFHALEFIPLLFLFKKKIVEFHGTRLRKRWADGSINENAKTPQWIFYLYSLFGIKCLYSTPDLKSEIPIWINATYLPNPVDTEHFKKIEVKNNGYALYSKNHYENADERLNNLDDRNDFLHIEILDREKGEFIKYKDMPNILKEYEFYIDRNNIHSLSKTALECLSMDIKVIDWKNEVIEGLPKQHDPYSVARKTIEIYDSVFRGKHYE